MEKPCFDNALKALLRNSDTTCTSATARITIMGILGEVALAISVGDLSDTMFAARGE
jgi:hypothetical protein